MAASFTKSRKSIVHPFHPLSYKVETVFPIRMPALSTSFPSAIPNQIRNALVERGYEEAVIKGQKVLIFQRPDGELIQTLRDHGANSTSVAPGNCINISCIPVIVTIRRILSSFLQVHTYPAFRDENQLNDVSALETVTARGKRKIITGDVEVSDEHPRKRGPAASTSTGTEDVDMEPQTTSSDSISVALPQTLKKGWIEDGDDLPTTGGLFFHYIPDLAHPDSKSLPRVMSIHFVGCFGSNKNEALTQLELLRSRWGVISDTDLGKELTHLCKVIDIGLRAQARIIPIFSAGVYNGCVLSGVGYSISLARKVYEPVDMNTLSEEIGKHTGNGGYLDAIVVRSGVTITGEKEKIRAVRSMMELKELLKDQSISEGDKDEIVKLASKLNLERHWPLNDGTIVSALRLAASSSSLKEVPIHHSMLFENDRISLVWSGFGFNAPSCNFIGGPVVDLSKNPSGSISFKVVPLPAAISDLKAIVSEKKFCKAQGGRRSGPFKDRTFDGARSRVIWEALKDLSGASSVGSSQNQGVGGQVQSSAQSSLYASYEF